MKNNINYNKSSEFSSLIFAISRRLREEARKIFNNEKKDGNYCTFIDFAVLNYVNEKRNPFMKDISENLFISKPAASFIVNSMFLKKLLKRVADSSDRRSIRIELTSYGKKYLLEQKKKKIAILEKVFFILNSEERKQLMILLEKVAFSDIKTK